MAGIYQNSYVTFAAFPLLTRAWVFQERLLASRVVHFSHHELVWECNQTGNCQCDGYKAEFNPKLCNWTSAGIHLVLQNKAFFSLDGTGTVRDALRQQDSRRRHYALSDDEPEAKYVRIGILRSPRADPDTTYWPNR
jgi:hypothetical protein